MNARWSSAWLSVVIVGLCRSGMAAAPSPTNTLVTTVSASRQFVACAHNRLVPSALCAYAERIKREWLRRIDSVDNWRDPIMLLVETRQSQQAGAPAVSIGVFQTDAHLEYRIRCLVPPTIDEEELSPAILDALCSEWASRNQATDPAKPYTAPQIPLWLVEGMASSFRRDDGTLLAVSRRSVIGGQPRPVRDVMAIEAVPADVIDRQLFRANAWVLTEGLLRLKNGPAKLRHFLSDLGEEKVASNAFWTVYRGDFPNAVALEKWWSLELVARTSESLAQDLSTEDTRRKLDAILVTRLGPAGGRRGMPGEISVGIADLWRYEDSPWLGDLLKIKIDRIGALRGVAHPLYLPALDEYMEALVWLQRDNITRFHRSLNRADNMRARADRESQGITAFLDQAERVYEPQVFSNFFTGYFQTFDQFQALQSERHSPISDYLDKFDH
ncbi:MAG TPA: hypothetical protein VMP11_12120 [Verrucomicrobiae bacterium]|nr:hypothetical protein [Verrucomicrobiae bacterium]